MLELQHQNEWLNSNVDIDIIELTVKSLEGTQPYDYLLYSNAISRRNGGRLRDRDIKKYEHTQNGGWWCSGVDPLNEYELMIWGCFKPNKPRRDLSEKKKVIKYEHPYKEPTRAFFLRLSYRVGLAIATKHGKQLEYQQRILQLYICSQQKPTNGFAAPQELPSSFEDIPVEWLRTEDRYFWKWVKESNVPITITEGAKKAGALLSAGYAAICRRRQRFAIALPGFNSGYRNSKDSDGNSIGNPYLIPEIAAYATPGRSITICFDYETKLQTVNNINAASTQLGRLLSIAGAKARIAQLPGIEKGVDDFIVASGVAAFDGIYEQALSWEQWQVRTYSTLTYTPNVIVRERYLSSIPIPEGAKLAGVQSGKGTGKTYCLIPIVESAIYNGQPVLILTHRVQLGIALAARFGVSYITEVRNDETGKLLGYALCVDSLHPNSQARFNADGWKDALVIIDEAEQVIWHTLDAKTEVRNNRVEVIRQFSKLMRNVLTSPKGRVIMCDADLTDLSFQFILGMAGIDLQPWILVNEWKPETVEGLIREEGRLNYPHLNDRDSNFQPGSLPSSPSEVRQRICYHYGQTTPVAWFAALFEWLQHSQYWGLLN